ncbi:DUF3473 domain-containing protein [Roseiconus nitratireducens]|uniref:DUF3473 domain-containing protein n=1 Tax=Roseiconus nitratireducens TaxID=2605748 RepID=A0A5M6DFI8_9BACT|nr:XrtA system polysaccharide deacetylase [Roseiconus nitratireducens]KAA5546291.1 DUF3473 domain-containing protein [Roseiconus nitratireducens]
MSVSVPNAMTIDVEDYFQVSGFEKKIRRANWDQFESRVVASTERLLAVLDDANVRGTFFILGWVAQRHPSLVRRIAREGHEIASHGFWHQLVYSLTPEAFAKDLADSKEAIASACGVVPTAYRAPSFSITGKSLWALEILVQQGFKVDSSVFPIRGHDRYGMPNAKKEIHWIQTPAGRIREFPPSIARVRGVSVPVGGGYFRLLPWGMTSQAIRRIQAHGRPAMFYTHPWEVDPGQPRIRGIERRSRFRHYVGLKRTEGRLRRMLSTYPFDTMESVLRAVESRTTDANGASCDAAETLGENANLVASQNVAFKENEA